jgi:hypothetical protein
MQEEDNDAESLKQLEENIVNFDTIPNHSYYFTFVLAYISCTGGFFVTLSYMLTI